MRLKNYTGGKLMENEKELKDKLLNKHKLEKQRKLREEELKEFGKLFEEFGYSLANTPEDINFANCPHFTTSAENVNKKAYEYRNLSQMDKIVEKVKDYQEICRKLRRINSELK